MSLIRKLLGIQKPPIVVNIPDIIELPEPVEPEKPKRKSRGSVVKVDRKPVFDIHANHQGGRVVRVMPRDLRSIKEAQERVDRLEE